jgi:hypothetical protein
MTGVFLTQEYKWVRLNCATIYRSDHFLEYCVHKRRRLPPYEGIIAQLEYKEEFKKLQKETEARIREQYPETAGQFRMPALTPGLLETLETKKVDVVLMDNLFDTSVSLCEFKPSNSIDPYEIYLPVPIFSNGDVIKSIYRGGPLLSAPESAAGWAQIVEFVRERQPSAKIFFLAGHYCTSFEKPERFRRARDFYIEFSRIAGATSINILPPLDLPLELTRMPEDFAHYDFAVYRALAGHLYLSLICKWPGWANHYVLSSDVLAF